MKVTIIKRPLKENVIVKEESVFETKVITQELTCEPVKLNNIKPGRVIEDLCQIGKLWDITVWIMIWFNFLGWEYESTKLYY